MSFVPAPRRLSMPAEPGALSVVLDDAGIAHQRHDRVEAADPDARWYPIAGLGRRGNARTWASLPSDNDAVAVVHEATDLGYDPALGYDTPGTA